MEENYAIVGIIAVVVISTLAVVYLDSVTGDISFNAYNGYNPYGGSKLYGGAIKKIAEDPAIMGKQFEKQFYLERAQRFLYENKDKWDCSYGKDAEKSPYPCVADENNPGKYCCVIPEDLPERYAQWAS